MMQHDRWFVGVDWAMGKHQVCILDGEGAVCGKRVFECGAKGSTDMVEWLVHVMAAGAEAIEVAIETPYDSVVETLMGCGFAVHVINPKQFNRFRNRFGHRFPPAHAKDDCRDAQVLADALHTDPPSMCRLEPIDPLVVELRGYTRMATRLDDDRIRIANLLQELLWGYFPQILKLSDDASEPWLLELWQLAPTPEKARCLCRSAIAGVLERHRVRHLHADEAIRILPEPAIPLAPGTAEAAVPQILGHAKQLKLIRELRVEADRDIDRLIAGLADSVGDETGQCRIRRDIEILLSLPGMDKMVLATLLTEAPDALRRRDYQTLRYRCGSIRASENAAVVGRCLAVHDRLRDAAYHWARIAIQQDPVSKAKYETCISSGRSDDSALRSVVNHLLTVACDALRDQTDCDPEHSN